jgi:hypothetical protein
MLPNIGDPLAIHTRMTAGGAAVRRGGPDHSLSGSRSDERRGVARPVGCARLGPDLLRLRHPDNEWSGPPRGWAFPCKRGRLWF